MARSYGTATLTLTVTEAITLNSKDEGQTHTHTIASIADVYRRTMTASTSTDTTIATFSSAFGVGQFVAADMRYLRITNLDDTNHVTVTLTNSQSDEVAIKIDKGQSFIICPDLSGGVADIFDANQNTLSFTDATCDYNNDPTITCDSSVKITPGLFVSGTGIPAGAYVSSVNTAGAVTSFELSASTTGGAVSNGTLTFTPGLQDLTTISAKADTAAADIELYMAMV
tara:strand:- start:635 stop:1315 length:681 start_codon:yes stop_codon:yes gene_type:complete